MWGRASRVNQQVEDLQRTVENLKEIIEAQERIAAIQQDSILALLIESQTERERARFVEQRFEQVCAVLMLLEQEFRRLISNGETPSDGKRIIVPTHTHQQS